MNTVDIAAFEQGKTVGLEWAAHWASASELASLDALGGKPGLARWLADSTLSRYSVAEWFASSGGTCSATMPRSRTIPTLSKGSPPPRSVCGVASGTR